MTKYGMAIARETSSSEVTSNSETASTVSSHGGMETSSLLVTGHKLTGYNYLQWSQSVMMFICGRGKDEYLTEEIPIPEKSDPKFRTWKTDNHLVMSWLINSMNNEIGENFLLYSTAKEIWEAARETYSSSENTAELFQIESALHDLRQGDLPVTQYFNTLTRYWQQLDMFETHTWSCSYDSAVYKKIVDQKRTFKFLLGLNKDLDEVRGRVMGTKPLPSVREAFSEVRREESRKKVMMGSGSQTTTLEGSALAARGQFMNNNSDNKQRRGRLWCDHCRRSGHTKETCWKLHGKPADWKSTRQGNDRDNRANIVTKDESPSPAEASPFTKNQLEALQQLFNQNLSSQPSSSVMGSSMLAQKGNLSNAFKVNKRNSWIIDSGA